MTEERGEKIKKEEGKSRRTSRKEEKEKKKMAKTGRGKKEEGMRERRTRREERERRRGRFISPKYDYVRLNIFLSVTAHHPLITLSVLIPSFAASVSE